MKDNPHQSLFRCNQFILGPSFAPGLDEWKRVKVGERLNITAHPELNVVSVSDQGRTLTLIGFMLDPNDSLAGDKQILDRLLARFESFDRLISSTSSLGGRWALLAVNGRETRLFADAFGLRQVYYCLPEITGDVYATSEASVAAAMLGLPVDDEAQAYMNSKAFRSNRQYKWPAAITAFKGIRRLLPNHYLDMRSGTCHRFWPQRALPTMTLDDGVSKIGTLMTGSLRAAAARFDLAVAVTCGIDSRVVLAACKNIAQHASFITVRQWHMSSDGPDITVSRNLLAELGFRHEVIYAPVSMSPEFSRIFKSSAYLAHDHYGPDAEAILNHYGRSKVAVTGSGGEVGRCPFRENLLFFDHKYVTPAYLSRIEIGEHSEFAAKHFKEWLRGIRSRHGINILDLFEWEQGCGSWLAMTQQEFDIAWKDIFTPFNCRDLITAMLSVPVRYRKGPRFILFERLIEHLWPEVAEAPINPHRKQFFLRRYLTKAELIARHILQPFRYR